MTDGDLKIFISWSGDLSREVTRELRQWLPKMFDRIQPWMSDVDIQAGTRALQLIEERLNESSFGIIVVTTENQHKTWLNFEAGALSKRFNNNNARVVPVLVNFDNFYQIDGPIRQFQGVMLNKEGIRDLLQSICSVAGSDWPVIEARLEWSWPEFEAAIADAKDRAGAQPTAPEVTEKSLLQELLSRVESVERNTAPTLVNPSESSLATRVKHSTELFNELSPAVELVLRKCDLNFPVLSWSRTKSGGVEVEVEVDGPVKTADIKNAIEMCQDLGVSLTVRREHPRRTIRSDQ